VGSGVVPSGVPLVFGIPEGVAGVAVVVGPGLAALTIGEIASGTTDCNVKDQIKILVERRTGGLVDPRVVLMLPSTLAEKVTVRHVNIEDDVVRGVDVGLESFRSPEEAVYVHLIC